jgi:choline dehydrogenase-like flavoprotein
VADGERGRAVGGTTFGSGTAQQGALAGLAALLLPPEAGGPPPEQLAGLLRDYLARVPAPTPTAVRGAARTLGLVSLATSGRRLEHVDLATRERLLARLASHAATGLGLEALKALVLLVHGADAAADDLLARAAANPVARPDAVLDVTPAAAWPAISTADVVVVGSGAGGAMVARELARHGLAVVVVEEGRRFTVDEFRSQHPLTRWTEMYRGAGTTMALGHPPVVLPLGRGVGGTTLVNSGTSFRTPARVLRRWRDRHGVDLADEAEFTTLLDEVERTLAVAPVPDAVMGANGRTTLRGAEALGWSSGPLSRNAPGCAGSCQCALGCPRNAKYGVHLNALPQACEAGARILSEARVTRVLHRRGRVQGVRARRRDGTELEIRAPRVVVACGTTQTPPLLRASGLGPHRQLGRNLALHPAVGVSARFDEPVVSWQGVLQSAQVDQFHAADGIMLEATAMPPGMGSIGMPGYGRRLLEELERADHYASLGAMIADAPSGAVHRVGSRTVVRYQLARTDAHRLLKAVALMGRVMLAAGAREVVTGVPGRGPVRSLAELDGVVGDADPRRLHVSAFHPTGTARLGADPGHSPVDPQGRLRGVDGVWVADGSVVPSCPEVNPQITIMALALGIAHRMLRT